MYSILITVSGGFIGVLRIEEEKPGIENEYYLIR